VLAPTSPPRPLGADTEAILQQLGYSSAEIASLRADGVV
jgi:crotonobetainyl-CoA:carnitine CoA-transferase CaiB-like acyl-CoA transferase